jgi:hypothetical protein
LFKKEAELDAWKFRLADHFCEDYSTFKMEDLFLTLYKFCQKIKTGSQVFKTIFLCPLKIKTI